MKQHLLQREAAHVSLTHDEKINIKGRLDACVRENPAVRTKPDIRYTTQKPAQTSFISYIISQLTQKPMAITLIIVLFLGGGGAYAAETSLPGDALYPIKIEVNERIRGWAAISGEADAQWEARIAERRLEEAERLAAENRLSMNARTEIESNFEAHAKRAHEHLDQLEANEKIDAAVDISSRFETSLRAHTAILERLSVEQESARAEIRPLLIRVRAQTNTAAETRKDTEVKISARAEADVRTAAEGRLTAAENKIVEVRSFIGRSQINAEAKARAEARLTAAEKVVVEGKAKIEAEAYNEAFLLFQQAFRIAQEAKLLITAEQNLNVNFQLDIPSSLQIRTGGESESNTGTDSHAESNIKLEGSVNTNTQTRPVNSNTETNSTVNVEIGL